MSLRSGSPGQTTGASFPHPMVLAPGSTVTAITFSYRYITGFEKTPSGLGANLSLIISDLDAATNAGDLVYSSPHLTECEPAHLF